VEEHLSAHIAIHGWAFHYLLAAYFGPRSRFPRGGPKEASKGVLGNLLSGTGDKRLSYWLRESTLRRFGISSPWTAHNLQAVCLSRPRSIYREYLQGPEELDKPVVLLSGIMDKADTYIRISIGLPLTSFFMHGIISKSVGLV
jgi:hypothetical protein